MTPSRPIRAVCYATIFGVEPANKKAWVQITDTEVGTPENISLKGIKFPFDWRIVGYVTANSKLGVIRFTSGKPSVKPLNKGDNVLLQIEIVGRNWKPLSWCHQEDVPTETKVEEVSFQFTAKTGDAFIGTTDSILKQLLDWGWPKTTESWPEGSWMTYNPSAFDFSPIYQEPDFPATEQSIEKRVQAQRAQQAA